MHTAISKKTYRLGCATQTSVQDKLGMHRKRVDEVDSHPVREVDTSMHAAMPDYTQKRCRQMSSEDETPAGPSRLRGRLQLAL